MMEWEEHLREMAQTADEHPEYKMLAWFTAKDAVAEIDRLRSEIARLTAELKEREGEVERLRDMIADSHDELLQKFDSNAVGHTDLYTWIKCILAKLERLKSLAASRLADQEAIERHTEKMVAREICKYLCKEWPFMGAGAVMDIKERYGVE